MSNVINLSARRPSRTPVQTKMRLIALVVDLPDSMADAFLGIAEDIVAGRRGKADGEVVTLDPEPPA